MRILSSSAEIISQEWAKRTSERYFQHQNIKFVSPSGLLMFRLFYVPTYNTTFFFGKFSWMFFKLGKSIDVKIWQLIEAVTGNCTVFAPPNYFVNEISKEPAARLSGKLFCNWLIMLVTMATPISSHAKDKNSIFTARDEDMIFQ